MYTKQYRAIRVNGGVSACTDCQVAVEDTIDLSVNNILIASILATPEMLHELAAGYLICEGIIKNPSEIRNIGVNDRKLNVSIDTTDHFEIWHELRSSGCVGVRWEENEDISITSHTVFKPEVLWNSLGFLDSDIYKHTHGTHAACLIDTGGKCVIKAIDVGRHNAFDKVVGGAVLCGIDLTRHFILSSGRQSAGMVLKAARAGIPVVATKTAPINTGIEAAERTGVCLVCFITQGSISVFSHPERIDI